MVLDTNRLYQLLERLGNLVRAEERQLGGDLPPVQLHALAYLARCNRYSDTPAAVTEYLGATKGTVSQTLKKLRERGLVAARPDPEDGRVQHLRLTARGKRIVAETTPRALLGAALDAVEDPAGLEAGLVQLLAGIQRANGGRAFGECATCRHFTPAEDGTRCGLTGEPLSTADAGKLCREHEEPARSA